MGVALYVLFTLGGEIMLKSKLTDIFRAVLWCQATSIVLYLTLRAKAVTHTDLNTGYVISDGIVGTSQGTG